MRPLVVTLDGEDCRLREVISTGIEPTVLIPAGEAGYRLPGSSWPHAVLPQTVADSSHGAAIVLKCLIYI